MELGRLDKKKVPQVAGDANDLQIRSRSIEALDLAKTSAPRGIGAPGPGGNPVEGNAIRRRNSIDLGGRPGINRANPVEDDAVQPENLAHDFVQVGGDVALAYAAEQQEALQQARFRDDARFRDIARQEAIDRRTQAVRRQQREKLGTSS